MDPDACYREMMADHWPHATDVVRAYDLAEALIGWLTQSGDTPAGVSRAEAYQHARQVIASARRVDPDCFR